MGKPCNAYVVVGKGMDLETALRILRNRLSQNGKNTPKTFYRKPSEERRAAQRKREGKRL